MEIDETFNSLEEIQTLLEKDGMTWRISADDDFMDEIDDDIEEGIKDPTSKIDFESASFSADADDCDIEKWEAELPDIAEGIEEESADEETESGNVIQKTAFEKEKVIYFDLFKKKAYVKTLIFQTEEGGEESKEEGKEKDGSGSRVYRLIGFCEAPMF